MSSALDLLGDRRLLCWAATCLLPVGQKYNPVIGIAAVSCVPTTAKVAQKAVSEVDPEVIVLPHALGANVCGVITTAVFAAVLVTILRP